MTASSLLANLVAVRGLPPEPVATEALEHLLATNHVASKGLDEVCRELVPGLDHDLEWRGQVRAEDSARPDLVGFTDGTARVVLEAKFTADLTALQATPTYLDRLKAGRPGLLLFVVPEPACCPLAAPVGRDRRPVGPTLTSARPPCSVAT